jgi:hypothetical protein
MPPFLLRSSAIISAAALAGTPNTEAGPDRNVAMPILSSFGLSWACAGNAKSVAAKAAAPDILASVLIGLITTSPLFDYFMVITCHNSSMASLAFFSQNRF